MKKSIVISSAAFLVVVLLASTNSLYVEWNELLIILGGIVVGMLFLVNNILPLYKRLMTSAIVGFFCCLIIGSADLVIDHYLYYQVRMPDDGSALSLGFKLVEYKDDLLFASMLIMMASVFLTLAFSKIRPSFNKKNA